MRKKSLKTVALAATASMVLLSTANCFAATVNTTTKYNLSTDNITVKTSVTDMANDGMVTYLLTKDSSAITSANASDNILYIEQKSSAGKAVDFEYTVAKSKMPTALTSVLKMGSNVSETFENIANSLKFGNITVFADNATVALTNANGDAIDSKYVIGNGETVNLTATAKDGYSIVKVKVGSTEYPTGSAITITGTGDPIEVEVITTSTTTNSVTKVADITETETLAGFVAKVIATDASAKYGAILKSGSDEKVIYAMKSESDSATVADSSYYAVKVTNTDGKAAKGDYTLTPFVEVNGTKTYGDAITFKVE